MISKTSFAIMVLAVVTFGLQDPLDDSPQLAREIKKILTTQAECWNAEDIDGFMQTYWKSPDLTFSGGGQTTRGWQSTLDRYKKSYPKGSMGTLAFDSLEVTSLGDSAALVLGNWRLVFPPADKETEPTSKQGNFTLVLRKLDGRWKIIHDHSSTLQSTDEQRTAEPG